MSLSSCLFGTFGNITASLHITVPAGPFHNSSTVRIVAVSPLQSARAICLYPPDNFIPDDRRTNLRPPHTSLPLITTYGGPLEFLRKLSVTGSLTTGSPQLVSAEIGPQSTGTTQ